MRTMPDTPKIDGYGVSVPAVSNSIVDQCMAKWWPWPYIDQQYYLSSFYAKYLTFNKFELFSRY